MQKAGEWNQGVTIQERWVRGLKDSCGAREMKVLQERQERVQVKGFGEVR